MDKPTKYVQLSLRTLLEVVALIAFFCAISYQHSGNPNGRYQALVTDPGPQNGPLVVHVIDSTSGQVWRSTNGTWTSLQPVPLPKK